MRGESIGTGSRAAHEDSRADVEDGLLGLLAAVDDWIFIVGADGRILRASECARAGLGLEDASGVDFAALWSEAQREPLAAALTALHGGSRAERVLLDLQAKPGVRIELRLTAGPFRGERATFGIGRELGRIPDDVSWERATTALSKIEQKYRAFLSSSMFGMAISEERGRYVEVNPAFERMIGWSAAETVGKNAYELGLIPSAVQAQAIEALDRHGPPQFSLLQYQRRDGALRTAMHSTNRVQLDGEPLAFTITFDITDYLRAQEDLREQDQQFRALFDNVTDGMFFADATGQFYEVNDAACKQLGYTREELLKLTVSDVSNNPNFQFGQIEKRFAEVDHMTYETEHRRKDGRVLPIELTLTHIEHAGAIAIVGIARDLTVKKKIQNELLETRDRLQATLQALPDLVFEYDADGVVLDYSASREEMLTVPPDKFLGRALNQLVGPDISSTLTRAIHQAIETGYATSDVYRISNGRYYEATAARRRDVRPGQKPRVIMLARDVTDRKLHEQELERKNDELMRFTYTVSHDLKSPLVTIKSFIGYLVADLAADKPEKVTQDIGYIRKAADRMDELLDDLLELSRIGRKVNPPEQLSLLQLCEETCELLAGRIKDMGAEVVQPDRDLSLWGDRVRLREVLQNLIDNALKFSLASQPVRVFLEVSRKDSEWIVSVRDQGIGVDPRYHHKLFGLFEKLHTGEGTGIGLALVKRIVEVHGGRVWLESQGEGHGTTVSFTLPNTQEAT